MATPALLPEQPLTPGAIRRPPKPDNLWLHGGLFVITLLSTTIVGMRYQYNFSAGRFPLASDADVFPFDWTVHHLHRLYTGLPFSCTLLGILLVHEFGHYLAARRYKVRATLPFMLPAPSLSGTAGAVIRLKSRIKSRAALLAIGAFGPIPGFIAAVFTTLLGLYLSKTVAVEPHKLVELNQPLLLRLLEHWLSGPLHRSLTGPMIWHPVLVASWIGLLITSLNLVPAGQLDGGHILYSVSPRIHRISTYAAITVLVYLGITYWLGWLLWTGLLLLPGMRHPTVHDDRPLTPKQLLLPPIALVIFLLCANPAPFRNTSLHDVMTKVHAKMLTK
jgi:membrane-associated protease RseP (regulator of RpoE activity)